MGSQLAEMLGQLQGRGRGGSMHIFDREPCFFGGNAIVVGGLRLAAGIALADKRLFPRAITACFNLPRNHEPGGNLAIAVAIRLRERDGRAAGRQTDIYRKAQAASRPNRSRVGTRTSRG